ncbi:RibD family protein [Kitasatospora sp. NPDC088134]|uniref:RibD family protein n=1 Tax=Kitasatospora sp. NPDC088134 TaxID=3364071 RepID=UPI003811D21A
MPRPHVLLSAAVSIDGHLDDASPDRLLLSNAADFDRVDALRAGSDAILVGGGTLRADNPRLLVNSPARRAERLAAGRPEHPLKVTLSASGRLDPELRFWHTGGAKLVCTTDAAAPALRAALADAPGTEVLGFGPTVPLGAVLDELGARGIGRLMVEGGGGVHTRFLAEGLADELHLAVAPLLVGQADAPRFLSPAAYPGGPTRRMRLLGARTVGDVVLLRYAPKESPDEPEQPGEPGER